MRLRSPLQKALGATCVMALFGVAFRLIAGALDPEFKSWAVVAISPLTGIATYVHATGRDPYPPRLMIGGGIVGLAFWVMALVTGLLPVTAPSDWLYVAIILAFPAILIGLGIRKERTKASSRPSAHP